MRKTLKVLFYSALILFVGVPVAFALFVAAMAMFGIAIGIGSEILGLVLTVLKFALMVVLPLALLVWVVKRLLAPERTYSRLIGRAQGRVRHACRRRVA